MPGVCLGGRRGGACNRPRPCDGFGFLYLPLPLPGLRELSAFSPGQAVRVSTAPGRSPIAGRDRPGYVRSGDIFSTPERHPVMSTDAKNSARVKVVVATTVMLSFISFWRAAAIVLNDLGASA